MYHWFDWRHQSLASGLAPWACAGRPNATLFIGSTVRQKTRDENGCRSLHPVFVWKNAACSDHLYTAHVIVQWTCIVCVCVCVFHVGGAGLLKLSYPSQSHNNLCPAMKPSTPKRDHWLWPVKTCLSLSLWLRAGNLQLFFILLINKCYILQVLLSEFHWCFNRIIFSIGLAQK